ncbi:MAG: tellurite resistance TerB family protein [Mangrovicoccus sp.]|nr:tellurite resistance TerB family protein [Mangrovicoccus sp.]
MSMVKTLAKAAVGIAVAKGVGSMMSGGRRSSRGRSSGGGIEDLLGAALGGGSGRGRGGSSAGIEDLLGAVLGGGAGGALAGRGGAGGGIEDLLGAVLGGGAGGAGTGKPYGGSASRSQADMSGGLGGALGQIFGAQGPRGRGSMGGALDELSRMSTGALSGGQGMAEAASPFGQPNQGSFGALFNESLTNFGEPARSPSREEEALAELLLRALIQAAKADGQIDTEEQRQLTKHLGELDQEEIAFVNAELEKPIDVKGLARDVPRGAQAQVYMMSLMGIDLDTKQEAQYLAQLTQALGLSSDQANAIHDRMGEPRIFR